MMTIRDMMKMPVMESFKLIAGASGLDNEVKKVGILDYEFTPKGMASFQGQTWLPGEFILTSFMYTADNEDKIYDAVRKLVKKCCPGIAIRNVFELDIGPEVIQYANQKGFPIFIITDHNIYFEDFIIATNNLKNQICDNYRKKELVTQLLKSDVDEETIKKLALQMNYAINNSFIVYYIRANNNNAEDKLKFYNICGINDSMRMDGDTWIPYNEGVFFIHSINQYKKGNQKDSNYIFTKLNLVKTHFTIGISNHQWFLFNLKTALMQAYYAYCFAKIYDRMEEEYKNIGIYQILLPANCKSYCKDYLKNIINRVCEYDEDPEQILWNTLLCYEMNNGNYNKVAVQMSAHTNTIRYRIRKIFDIFDKNINDKNFESELFMAVKLYRIQEVKQEELLLEQVF